METGRTLIVVMLLVLAIGFVSAADNGIDPTPRLCETDADCVYCTADGSSTYEQYDCIDNTCTPNPFTPTQSCDSGDVCSTESKYHACVEETPSSPNYPTCQYDAVLCTSSMAYCEYKTFDCREYRNVQVGETFTANVYPEYHEFSTICEPQDLQGSFQFHFNDCSDVTNYCPGGVGYVDQIPPNGEYSSNTAEAICKCNSNDQCASDEVCNTQTGLCGNTCSSTSDCRGTDVCSSGQCVANSQCAYDAKSCDYFTDQGGTDGPYRCYTGMLKCSELSTGQNSVEAYSVYGQTYINNFMCEEDSEYVRYYNENTGESTGTCNGQCPGGTIVWEGRYKSTDPYSTYPLGVYCLAEECPSSAPYLDDEGVCQSCVQDDQCGDPDSYYCNELSDGNICAPYSVFLDMQLNTDYSGSDTILTGDSVTYIFNAPGTAARCVFDPESGSTITRDCSEFDGDSITRTYNTMGEYTARFYIDAPGGDFDSESFSVVECNPNLLCCTSQGSYADGRSCGTNGACNRGECIESADPTCNQACTVEDTYQCSSSTPSTTGYNWFEGAGGTCSPSSNTCYCANCASGYTWDGSQCVSDQTDQTISTSLSTSKTTVTEGEQFTLTMRIEDDGNVDAYLRRGSSNVDEYHGSANPFFEDTITQTINSAGTYTYTLGAEDNSDLGDYDEDSVTITVQEGVECSTGADCDVGYVCQSNTCVAQSVSIDADPTTMLPGARTYYSFSTSATGMCTFTYTDGREYSNTCQNLVTYPPSERIDDAGTYTATFEHDTSGASDSITITVESEPEPTCSETCAAEYDYQCASSDPGSAWRDVDATCSPSSNTCYCRTEPLEETDCSDNVDNDGDGDTDFEDSDCEDNNDPVIEDFDVPSTVTIGQNFRVDWEISDETDINYRLYLDGSRILNIDGGTRVDDREYLSVSTPGSHSLRLRARDEAGNIESETEYFTASCPSGTREVSGRCAEGNSQATCSDGDDNDGDGTTDFADADCDEYNNAPIIESLSVSNASAHAPANIIFNAQISDEYGSITAAVDGQVIPHESSSNENDPTTRSTFTYAAPIAYQYPGTYTATLEATDSQAKSSTQDVSFDVSCIYGTNDGVDARNQGDCCTGYSYSNDFGETACYGTGTVIIESPFIRTTTNTGPQYRDDIRVTLYRGDWEESQWTTRSGDNSPQGYAVFEDIPSGDYDVRAEFLEGEFESTLDDFTIDHQETEEIYLPVEEGEITYPGCVNNDNRCDYGAIGYEGCFDESDANYAQYERVLRACDPTGSAGRQAGDRVVLSQNSTHKEVANCCMDLPRWEETPQAEVDGEVNNLIKFTRLVTYQGQPVKFVIATWN